MIKINTSKNKPGCDFITAWFFHFPFLTYDLIFYNDPVRDGNHSENIGI